MLGLAFVDNQEQEQPSLPSPRLVKILKVNSWMKLMQHLKICLPKDVTTTEAYFAFQLTKIVVFLSCRHKMEYNCCQVSFFWNVWCFVVVSWGCGDENLVNNSYNTKQKRTNIN